MTSTKSASLVAIILAVVNIASGATPQKPDDFFKSGELNPDVALCGRQFHVPTVLGPTGMNGWIFNNVLVVREVETGSPADGIALPNDIIQAVNGKTLGAEPLKTFGLEIETAERTGKLSVQILRAGAKKQLSIPIRKLGAFSKDWPFNCAKSRAIHIDACEYLARIQNTDGTFDGKIHVGFALNGLTWLASDDPKYLENARRLAYGYRKYFDPEGTSTTNWGWGYMGMFMAEYYLKTGDRTILPICETIADTLAQSQMPCGSWGHGPYPGLGYVQGGNLNNCGLVCWIAMVLIKETGAEVNETALAKATKFFSRFAFRGTVPYGDHRPEFGGGNGKNAIPGVCFTILGDKPKSEYFARMVTGSYRGRTGGHTGGFMGFVWGNVHGAKNPHYPDYRRMLDHWTWLMNVSRRWDGGFLLPESIIGHIYTYRGPVLATGGMAQVYAMPSARLRIHGGPKSVFAAQDLPAEIKKGVELYHARKFDQLRKTVKPVTDQGRQLLAAADSREKDIKLTFAKIEAAMTAGDLAGATQMTCDLSRSTGGARDLNFGAIRWRIKTHKNASKLDLAKGLYDRYKCLTYTHPKAREAFEKLATDPTAGPYQTLARNELATSPDASLWTFYSELLYKGSAETWRIDDRARASMIRVSGIRSGNWTQIASLNTLYESGVLTDKLKENWTALAGAYSPGYPGKKPIWRILGVTRGQAPPAGWNAIDFDDSKWTSGEGPLSGRGAKGMQTDGRSDPYLRINFDCDRTDYKSLALTLRLMKSTRAVAFLNGKCILWGNPTQGPRMRMNALVTIDLPPATIKLLVKGRNVLAVRLSSGQGADFGLYATPSGDPLSFTPRPADWAPGVKMPEPDLSHKTPVRRSFASALPPVTTGLTVDAPGKPNDSISPLRADFIGDRGANAPRKTPLDQRAKYMGHFDSRIRRDAAYSLMADGAKAMPYILKALDSNDIRVIRAGCDALGGNYRMNGRGMSNLRQAMTTDIAGQAVPKLLPLLKHKDAYVREGALMALANCGKAAAPHLDKVNALANDEEWWVRAGVAYVLGYVEEPQTQGKADKLIEAFAKETSVFGRNRLRESLVNMAKRGHNTDAVVKALIEETKHPHGFYSATAISALASIGRNAKAAAPLFEAKLIEAKKQLAEAKTDSARKKIERRVKSLQGTINAMTSAPKPPKPPRKKKK